MTNMYFPVFDTSSQSYPYQVLMSPGNIPKIILFIFGYRAGNPYVMWGMGKLLGYAVKLIA